jgi:hypothetical protein
MTGGDLGFDCMAMAAARSTIAVERSDGDAACISSTSVTRIAVIVPLVGGAGDRARALIAAGPPVDPASWPIEEQQVFVTDSEVAFVFETDDEGILSRLVGGPILWAAAEWSEIAAEAPHVASADYSWSRPQDEASGLTYKATPGPGYSEGGDVFAP